MKDRPVLDEQQRHWHDVYEIDPGKFGEAPSGAALLAHELFSAGGIRTVIELGCGAGRDTLFFWQQGLHVTATDYAASATKVLAEKSRDFPPGRLTLLQHDVRLPLPFESGSFDACYSHMLLCMALTTKQIEGVLREIGRILKPGGL